MIIQRKYEYFWRLIQRDPEAKEIYEKACRYHNEKDYKHIYDYNLQNRAYNLEFGCGIRDPRIIWDGFDELDKTKPYDNGFTLKDINYVEILDYSDPEDDDNVWLDVAYLYKFDGYDHIVMIEHKEQ